MGTSTGTGAINNDGTVNQEAVTSSYRIVNGNGNGICVQVMMNH